MSTPDRAMTAWAAACAEHALASFATLATDGPAAQAISTARSWAAGATTTDACREAAVEAQRSASDAQQAGYLALATAIRSASAAAGSVDDSSLATDAAGLGVTAVELNSAACELASMRAAERRWQWAQLGPDYRAQVFASEPPLPAPAACSTPEVAGLR